MPASTLPAFMPYLATAGVALMLYRRIRGSFGRQAWKPKRTTARAVLLGSVAAMLVLAAVYVRGAALAVPAGMLVGVLLGAIGLHRTRFETHDGRPTYIPDPWIGAGLTLLLVARIAWRAAHGGFANGVGASSPLTIAIASTVVAFYLVQAIGLVLRMRRLAPA